MADFAYSARNLEGAKVTGTIAAASERDALNLLSAQSLFPLEIAVEKPRAALSLGGRVSGQMMAMTYSQLAALLRAGVPLLRSIAVLRDQSSNPTLAKVLGEVHGKVEEGTTLADAMEKHPKVFREMAVLQAMPIASPPSVFID